MTRELEEVIGDGFVPVELSEDEVWARRWEEATERPGADDPDLAPRHGHVPIAELQAEQNITRALRAKRARLRESARLLGLDLP